MTEERSAETGLRDMLVGDIFAALDSLAGDAVSGRCEHGRGPAARILSELTKGKAEADIAIVGSVDWQTDEGWEAGNAAAARILTSADLTPAERDWLWNALDLDAAEGGASSTWEADAQ